MLERTTEQWPGAAQRIAFFGGTFDPPHLGHLAIAAAAADRFSLDLVCFAPAGRQPLKPEGASASYEQRLAMVGIACEVDARFRASRRDAPRADGTPNYTVDALQELASACPGAAIFNLVGADSFHTLAQWHDPQRLLELAEWIVVSRPGYELVDPAGMTLSPAQKARIHLLRTVQEDVAATSLRQRLAQGDACGGLLSPGVEAYIAENRLYR